MALFINLLVSGAMDKEKIDIADTRSGLSSAFNQADCPAIEGSNYFTGTLKPEMLERYATGQVGVSTTNTSDWNMIWQMIGEESPGEIPFGARASFMTYAGYEGLNVGIAAVASLTDDGTQIDWLVRSEKKQQETDPRSIAYAVVLLPDKGTNSEMFTYVNVNQELAAAAHHARMAKLKNLRAQAPKIRPT